ncbi:hypothetical protein ACLB2K_036177 [Fragaria x ananassa]
MSGSQKPSSAKKGLVPSGTQKKAKSMADKLKSTLEREPSLEKSQSETKGRLRKIVEKVDDEVSDEDEDENEDEDEDEVDVSSIIQGLFRYEDEIEALRIEQEEKKERLSRAKKQKLAAA